MWKYGKLYLTGILKFKQPSEKEEECRQRDLSATLSWRMEDRFGD